MIGPSWFGACRQRAGVPVGLRLVTCDAPRALTTDKDRRLPLSFGVSQSIFLQSVLLAEVRWYLIRYGGDLAAAPNHLDVVDTELLRPCSSSATAHLATRCGFDSA